MGVNEISRKFSHYSVAMMSNLGRRLGHDGLAQPGVDLAASTQQQRQQQAEAQHRGHGEQPPGLGISRTPGLSLAFHPPR